MRKLATSFITAALVAGPISTGSAAVILFLDEDIPIPTTFAGVSVDFETGAFETDIDGLIGGDANFLFGGEWITNDADESAVTPSWQPVRIGTGTPAPTNTDLIRNLGIGAIVGPSSVFASGYGGSAGHVEDPPNVTAPNESFEPGQTGYIGFSLVLADTSVVYGWAEVTLQDDNTPGTIHSWAYEDNGSPLAVGSIIPEPSHTLLIILGLGASALRRRR